MKELFERFVMYFCFAGLGGIAVVAFVRATLPTAAQKVRMATEKVRRHGVVATLAVAIFVCGMIVYGSSKNNSQTNEPPSRMRMLVRMTPSELTNALVRVERWWRRGALNDGEVVTFDSDWCFPYGTNHLTRVEVWASGAVYPSEKDPTPIAELMTKLSLKPHDTEVLVGRTTNNSYRIEWRTGHPNRAHDQTADASIELCRNGDVVVTEGGVSTEIPYEIPFAHCGFGQDEDWVRANFGLLRAVDGSLTNAEQILSVGYANWVDSMVGVGLTNGLYKFTASFTEDPPETTQFWIGDYSLAVTNSGEYVFVLKKGEEYGFDTWPYDETVDYWMQDDLGPDSPMVMSWWDWPEPGEWTVDGGWSWFSRPIRSQYWYDAGYCTWMPCLRGFPNVAHLGPTDFPMTFSAILTDVCGAVPVTYQWAASSESIHFATPNAQSTVVTCSSLPSWDQLTMSVEANLGGHSLYSYVYPTYGTNETPQAKLSIKAPKVLFVNDDDRTSRWYRVSVSLFSPTETNAAVTITRTGRSDVVFSTEPEGEVRFSDTNICLSVSVPMTETSYEVFCASTNSYRSGDVEAIGCLQDQETLVARQDHIVIEPLRKLITKEVEGASIINPSRLVFGTNAWLGVDQDGRFSSQAIRWRVVSGPGEIVATNGYRACVCATEPTGTVVVEAAFGTDANVQPRFVLPVVEKRRVPVAVYYVEDVYGAKPAQEAAFESCLDAANMIYAQVGIEFYQASSSQAIADPSYSNLPEHDMIVGSDGRCCYDVGLSAKAESLLNLLGETNETIRVIYVSKITHGDAVAFAVRDYRAVVVGPETSTLSLSHEIGHVLGLADIYSCLKSDPYIVMPGWNDCAYKEMFGDIHHDWGEECGRSFYDASDTHGALIEQLLMNGFGDGYGIDIPSGSVVGYPSAPRNTFDKLLIEVGANVIRGE